MRSCSPSATTRRPTTVFAEVTAFSRHATWWSRLGFPVTALVQRVITDRYLRAL